MDHLCALVKKICPDSDIAKKLSCGRTKTTAILCNVLGDESFTQLCNELKDKRFSLIVDESTDKSTTVKHLCLVVRFTDTSGKVKDNFLTLIKLVDADANTLYKHIVDFFEAHEIPYKTNLVGLASDGANVMMGNNHSLKSLLLQDIPNLFVMKCICHSFHLCASYACQKLPRFVEDLTRDISNYFNASPKRSENLKEFQAFCNVKMHKILHPSQTRWLSVHMVVSRILEQYGALILYFTDAVSSNDLLIAENILSKLNDPVTKLFLQFLDFIIPFFENLNKEMQAESPKIFELHKKVATVLKSICECFLDRSYLQNTPIENVDFKNPRHFLKIEEVYFGVKVAKTIAEKALSDNQVSFFRLRCLDFYIEACKQIVNRFPLKGNIVKELECMSPSTVKAGNLASLATVAIHFPNMILENELQQLDTEWRTLRNVDDIQNFEDDVEIFWDRVRKLKFGDETPMFPVLSKFMSDLLILPHSSANVERIFSSVNLMKTKQRNRLTTETLSGLLHAKRYMGGSECHDFAINKNLLKKMDKKNLYKGKND